MMGYRALLLCSASMAAALPNAFAQDVGAAPPSAAQSADEAIIVTGSRIVRRDFTAESPIATISDTFIADSGPATVEQALNAMPQFQATQNGQTSSMSTFGAGSSGGRSNANLRGLGAARTLILFDGRRLQPSDTSGAIDLNTIAPSLISRVEVITGGASAVYGSDAISGVVNFMFNDRFRGLELQADAGISDDGDAATYGGSATWGGSLADDRARLFLSGSYFERGTASQQARRFFDRDNGTSTPTSGLILQVGSNPFGFGDSADVAAYRDLFVNIYGATVPPVASSFNVNSDRTIIGRTGAINLRDTETTGYLVSDGVVRQRSLNDSTLQLPLKRYTAFGRAELDLGAAVTAYAQFNYAAYKTDQLSSSGITQSVVGPISIRADNPFITGDLRTLANVRPNPNAPLSYYFNGGRIGRLRVQEDYDVYQLLGGFKGSLGGSLRFDIYASYGETDQASTAHNQLSRTRFNQVVNAADGGASLCAGGYDPFGIADTSQSCKDYLTFSTTNNYRFDQTVVQANLTGDLFALPAGNAAFAVGAEYRKNSYVATLDPRNSPTPTGTPGVTTHPEALGTAGALSSQGDISVKEIYGELLLPILRDKPMFEQLDINLAYRYSDYDRIGGVHTYKASANWSLFDGLGVRGGYSRAIRAPSLGDLFSPKSGASGVIGLASTGAGDPCDINGRARRGLISGVNPADVRALCIAQGVPDNLVDNYSYSGNANAAYRVGNPNLKEETADSYTIGAIFQPNFMRPTFRNLSFSVDYYTITVDDAIGYVTSPIALQQCFNYSGENPTYSQDNYYCGLIARDASGILAYIDEPLFNLAKYKVSGLDFQLDAAMDVAGLGTLLLNSALTYVVDYKIQSVGSEPSYDYAGTIGNTQIDGFSSTHPAWKHVTSIGLSGKSGSISLRWRYIGKMQASEKVVTPNASLSGVPAISYFDLVGRVSVNKEFELRGGVTNLTDKQPPEFGGPSVTATSTYDVIGRRYFLGATARF
jgi:iron complex outermembrane receptor protein